MSEELNVVYLVRCYLEVEGELEPRFVGASLDYKSAKEMAINYRYRELVNVIDGWIIVVDRMVLDVLPPHTQGVIQFSREFPRGLERDSDANT